MSETALAQHRGVGRIGKGRAWAERYLPAQAHSYCCSVLYRLAIVSVEVAPAQTRTLSILPGK